MNLRIPLFVLLAVAPVPFFANGQSDSNDRDEVTRALLVQTKPCWDGVEDLSDFTRLVVKVQVMLDRDGNVMSEPVLVTPVSVPETDPEMKIAIRRVFRAVSKCAPYELPKNNLAWPLPVIFNFQPESSIDRENPSIS